MNRRRPRIEVCIEELALLGFDDLQRAAIVDAFREALTRQLSEGPGSISPRQSAARLDAGSVEVQSSGESNESGEALGKALGERVGRAIAR